jgi:site-specific DNA-methyltransferase (adenine-specific)
MSLLVINGNNIELLKQYPDNYFDSVVTDPPYGLGKEPDAAELMKDWIEQGYHEIKGTGFMGKEWDAFVPQPLFWKEVFRVLKHGGHIVAFYGTRTYDWGVMAMRFAGFEVRDCIQWLYGTGFPKSHNISKAIDKLNGVQSIKGELKFKGGTQLGVINDDSWKPKDVYEEFANSEDAKNWEGWGSALKPANEPIVLARKPLEKGLSIAENVLKWGTGGINIDGCRITTSDKLVAGGNLRINSGDTREGKSLGMFQDGTQNTFVQNDLGRFPANIILTHHPECECKGLKKVKSEEEEEETIEDWSCHPDCPIKILDEQSGVLKSGKMKQRIEGGQYNVYGKMYPRDVETIGDSGGASRFFYVAKASKSERNKGLEGFADKYSASAEFRPNHMEKAIEGDSGNPYGRWTPIKNFHPTVKPVKLMQYLVRLVTPPNGKVLDPFCGSGTTGIACKIEGFEFVGMEQDPEYTKIAEARIKNWEEEKEEKTHIIQKSDTPIIKQQTLF